MKQLFAMPLKTELKQLKGAAYDLKKHEGVHQVHTNRRQKLITVEFDETLIQSTQIIDILSDLGIETYVLPPTPSRKSALRQVFAWIITLFMIYLTLASRIVLPIPEVFSYPLSAGISQLVLMLSVWTLCN